MTAAANTELTEQLESTTDKTMASNTNEPESVSVAGNRTTRKNTSFKITNIVVPVEDQEYDDEYNNGNLGRVNSGNGVLGGYNASVGNSKVREGGEPVTVDHVSRAHDDRIAVKKRRGAMDLNQQSSGSIVNIFNERQSLLHEASSRPPLSMAWASYVLCRGSKGQFVVSVAMANETTQAGPKDRFKVVKIAEKEAVIKGRWKCFDFADKPIHTSSTGHSVGAFQNSNVKGGIHVGSSRLFNNVSNLQQSVAAPSTRVDMSAPSSMTSSVTGASAFAGLQQQRPIVQHGMSQPSGLSTASLARPITTASGQGFSASSNSEVLSNHSNRVLSQFQSHPQFSQPFQTSTTTLPSRPLVSKGESYGPHLQHPSASVNHSSEAHQSMIGVDVLHNPIDASSVSSVNGHHQPVDRLEEVEPGGADGHSTGLQSINRTGQLVAAENGVAVGDDVESLSLRRHSSLRHASRPPPLLPCRRNSASVLNNNNCNNGASNRSTPLSVDNANGCTSESNQGAIDNRIEQAMDLVKSHLMSAVRSEVEELKDKIATLEETITRLQTENDFLRSHVQPDVILQLQAIVHNNNQQQQQQLLLLQQQQQQQQLLQQQQQQQQHQQTQQPPQQIHQQTQQQHQPIYQYPQQQQQPLQQQQQRQQQRSGSVTPIQK